ncbi:MAG: hypothetical protein Q4E87_08650, partial [bacterium]|nr:hypothetical protein [bacterium]
YIRNALHFLRRLKNKKIFIQFSRAPKGAFLLPFYQSFTKIIKQNTKKCKNLFNNRKKSQKKV